MPNIILNTYCNLSCPYCFANLIKQEKQNITLSQFSNILKWLEPTMKLKQDKMIIGLIGGEPTLHPYFSYLIKKIDYYHKLYNTNFILFTNGIKLYEFIDILPDHLFTLINYNSQLGLDYLQKLELEESLKLINKNKIALGCNIYQGLNNYDFFWDAVNKYNINNIRVSVAAPIFENQKNNKDLYYESLKIIFLNFMDKALQYNKNINFDCNQIPICYFTEEQILKYHLKPKICTPAIDITPDFNFIPCFGVSEIIKNNNFSNIEEVCSFVVNNNYKSIIKQRKCNNCSNCQYFINQCQGGCLAFK